MSKNFPCNVNAVLAQRIENRNARWRKARTRREWALIFPFERSVFLALIIAPSRSPLHRYYTRNNRESRRFLMEPIKYCTAVCYNTSYAFLRPSPSIYRHLRFPPQQRFSFRLFDTDFNHVKLEKTQFLIGINFSSIDYNCC